ncbi:MAG: serine/threonine protein kinase [Piscinibacter sp.]|uniref:serine/threonine-protein kinase n=1 Tax=Piscinibacter sp. TaxID=1903157 RepID=UPI00258F80C4|nr:serine/threonine-protein kinase [Piscinibacter sp.]MCW5667960.1 serine/threonine protein kinase [Piscinibacter sp.]
MGSLNLLAARWSEISALLDQALALPREQRAAWLAAQVGVDEALRRTVHMLLEACPADTGAGDDFLAGLPARLLPATLEPVRAAGLEPGGRVGPYELVEEIGRGGMGAVWLARRIDGAFEREVALKLPLLNRLRPDLAPRFRRERDILARLEHPNIARLYDAGVSADGLPYLAMERVIGQPINRWCDERRLGIAARLRLFEQVLDAVQYAHAHLVIHRDLKPANILVTTEGQVRLLDFGIAKLLADEDGGAETALTQMAGRALTPDYASPEQVTGNALTIASDVYALGVVLFELLTGQRPYRLAMVSAAQMEQAIVAADVLKPSAALSAAGAAALGGGLRHQRARLAGDLDTIVLKALAKLPAQRYATAAGFADDLRRHRRGEPVLAQPMSWRYRTRRFVERHRVAVGAAATIFAALVGATGISWWQAQLAARQAARAEAVKEFVLSFFAAADVELGATRHMSSADLLKQARERLDTAAIGDDAIRVELLTTVGKGLLGLGELDGSLAVLDEALQIARRSLGDAHRATATAALEQGFALQLSAKCVAAAASFAVAERFARTAGDLRMLSAALRGKACAHMQQGEPERAIEAARESVSAAERQAAPVDRRELLQAYVQAAITLEGAQRAGAIDPARRAYALARELYGQRPTKALLDARSVHAMALAGEGQMAAAAAEQEAVLAQQLQLLGAEHQEVVFTRNQLGLLYRRWGDMAASLRHYDEALRVATVQSGGRPTWDVATVRMSRANTLTAARRFTEALEQWQQAEREVTALLGAASGAARTARAGAAIVLTRLGRLDDAEAAFRTLPAAAPAAAGTLQEAAIRLRLGALRSAQGRHDEALSLIRGAKVWDERAPPAVRDRERALWSVALGQAQLAGGQPAEALAAFADAQALLAPLQPQGSQELADCAAGIERARRALGLSPPAPAAATAPPGRAGAGVR